MSIKKNDNLDVCALNNIHLDNNTMLEQESISINYPKYSTDVSEHLNNKFCSSEDENLSLVTNNKRSKYTNNVISCSESIFDICLDTIDSIPDFPIETDESLARKRVIADNCSKTITGLKSCSDLSKFSNSSNFEEFDYLDDRERLDEYITTDINKNYQELQDEFYKNFYEKIELEDIAKSSNYNNECFCYYCKNNLILPDFEIINFINSHLESNKNSKYLLLVFRLCPRIFSNYDVMANKQLRKYIRNYLGISDDFSNDKSSETSSLNDLNNVIILNQYLSKITGCLNSYIYENLFHQPNLKYVDYVKCDSCKNYMCPKHTYLSNCYYAKCKSCNIKTWTICGWCKSGFNEDIACKYLHH